MSESKNIIKASVVKFLGHLQEQPMVGGDLATRYPIRMAVGMLHNKMDVEEWLFSKSNHFPHGEKEVEVILKQLKRGSTPKTSSCGRVLDAVSAILGICYKRTYEGEPAIKLESAAIGGKDVLLLNPELKGDIVKTTCMVHEIYHHRNSFSKADLAYSAQAYISKGLAQLALQKIEEQNLKAIGFTGGVAYNKQITLTLKQIVEENGYKFYTHEILPPGDGGISFGQVIATALNPE